MNFNPQEINSDKDLVIHLGYPKSASTTLQKHLFQKHPDINNLGRYPYCNIGFDSEEFASNALFLNHIEIKEFYNQLVNSNTEDFFRNKIQFYYDTQKLVNKFFTDSEKNLLSNESFTSVFFTNDNIQEKILRVYELFPKAKVFFVIRKQEDIIVSQYRDHPFNPLDISRGMPLTYNNWVKTLYKYENRIKFLSALKYYTFIKLCIDLWGKENTGVFLFEELVKNPDEFTEKISVFLNIDKVKSREFLNLKHENKGVSRNYFYYRCINRMIPWIKFNKKNESFLKQGTKIKPELNKNNKKMLNDYFKSSNNKLMNLLPDLSLYKYGYSL